MLGFARRETSQALPLEGRESHEDENKAFVERVCLPFLLSSQNEDGGWGFRSENRSRVEASAWALLALRHSNFPMSLGEPITRGLRFLEAAQLPDGSWPASAESREGCWVTSLACWALLGVDRILRKRRPRPELAVRRSTGGIALVVSSPAQAARQPPSFVTKRFRLRLELDVGDRKLGGTDVVCRHRTGKYIREFITRGCTPQPICGSDALRPHLRGWWLELR